MEFKKGDKPETKMLHELIELAKAGKNFKAKSHYGNLKYFPYDFVQDKDWSTDFITNPWQYEEIKEPRVVEFECEWSGCEDGSNVYLYPSGRLPNGEDYPTLYKRLKGCKWKVVCTEVIDE